MRRSKHSTPGQLVGRVESGDGVPFHAILHDGSTTVVGGSIPLHQHLGVGDDRDRRMQSVRGDLQWSETKISRKPDKHEQGQQC